MHIIGIVGPVASGKGVVTEYLIKKFGYTSFSLSSIVHDELKKRGIIEFDRTTLQNIGDELRKKEGDGTLAKRAVQKFNAKNVKLENKRIVIEGIRNPGEVHYLRTLPGFFLIAVDALQEVRYQRVLTRGKKWDPKDWESFKKIDSRDSNDIGLKNGQHVRACMALANVCIENNSDLLSLKKEIQKKLSMLS